MVFYRGVYVVFYRDCSNRRRGIKTVTVFTLNRVSWLLVFNTQSALQVISGRTRNRRKNNSPVVHTIIVSVSSTHSLWKAKLSNTKRGHHTHGSQ